MRIRFSGIYDIPEEHVPDDRGSIDIWLRQYIRGCLRDEEMAPDNLAYVDPMRLDWEVLKE